MSKFRSNFVFVFILLNSLVLSNFATGSIIHARPLSSDSAPPVEISTPITQTIVEITTQLLITSNAGFTSAGFSGSGNIDEPYVLSEYSINTGSVSGIEIRNTDAYFLIDSVSIVNSDNSGAGGVHLTNVKNGKIQKSNFSDCDYGIYIYGSSYINILENNFQSNSKGIMIKDSSNFNLISQNTVSNSLDSAIYIDKSNNNTVINNYATENNRGIIFAYSSHYNVMKDNNIRDHNRYGIFVGTGSNYNQVINNTVVGNLQDGIFLSNYQGNAQYNEIQDNNVSQNGWNGIHVVGNEFNILTGNQANSNHKNGFLLEGTSNNEFSNNSAYQNHLDGFISTWSHYNEFEGNIGSDNGLNGFATENSAFNTFTKNRAINNLGSGYSVLVSPFSIFQENVAIMNSFDGFYFQSEFLQILDNTAERNAQNGFNLETVENSKFKLNMANRNNQHGFRLFLSHENEFTENHAISNNEYGIYLSYSFLNLIYYNFFTGNNLNNFFKYDEEKYIDNCRKAGPDCTLEDYTIISKSEKSQQGYDDTGGLLGIYAKLVPLISNKWDNTTYGNYWGAETNNYRLDGGYDIVSKTITEKYRTWEFGRFKYKDYDSYLLQWHYDSNPLGPEMLGSLQSISLLSIANLGSSVIKFEPGETLNHTLTWMPFTNLQPTNYTIYIDHQPVKTGVWEYDVRINWNILDLKTLGERNYSILISDHSGKKVMDTIIVSIEDTTAPVILYSGDSEMYIDEASSGNQFTADVYDLYPSKYSIYQGDVEITSWNRDSSTMQFVDIPIHISLNLDRYPGGLSSPNYEATYNFTLITLDTSGNSASLDFTIIVTNTNLLTSEGDEEDSFFPLNALIGGFIVIVVVKRIKKATKRSFSFGGMKS